MISVYETCLDGGLPVDELGQILAFIFVFGLVVSAIIGVIGCLKIFKRYLDNLQAIEEKKLDREQEWHDQEDENWRKIPGALQRRIIELEKTCKVNQEVIADLKLELASKKQFMDQMKVSDLYKKWREEQKD